MTLDELLELQRAWGLTHVHIAYLGAKNFLLAHTDEERVLGTHGPVCEVHEWLVEHAGPPAPLGLYVITPHDADQYSESYPYEPYDLHRLESMT